MGTVAKQLAAILLLTTGTCLPLPVEAKVMRYLKGNPQDVNPTLSGPVYDLGGGGADVDEAIQWMINRVRGCNDCDKKVDVVVIRATGDDGYNQPIMDMQGVDSVETILVTSKAEANQPEVVNAIQKAEVVFFAGGDQCLYTRNFQNTRLETAVESVYQRGGGIGGTSAGAMIQSNFVYEACGKAIETENALEDPYRDISFTYNLFSWRNLENTVIDTHFDRRERMGRLMAFLARQIQDGKSTSALGIAVSEGTSVVVDKNGMAKVMGKGVAYFVLADRTPEVCKPRQPLTYSNYKIWRVRSGDSFNLRNRPTTGYYLRSVKGGKIDKDPY